MQTPRHKVAKMPRIKPQLPSTGRLESFRYGDIPAK